MLVDLDPQRLDEGAGQRLAAEVEPMMEADKGIEPGAVQRQHRLGVQQRIAEREHRIHRIPRRPVVAATEFQPVGQQVGEALEVGRRTGTFQPAQRRSRVLLINGRDAGCQPLGNGTGVLVKKSW